MGNCIIKITFGNPYMYVTDFNNNKITTTFNINNAGKFPIDEARKKMSNRCMPYEIIIIN